MTPSLPSRVVEAGELLQHISRIEYAASPLYFGRAATNRYDDANRAYVVLYLSFDLSTALMESVFINISQPSSRKTTCTRRYS